MRHQRLFLGIPPSVDDLAQLLARQEDLRRNALFSRQDLRCRWLPPESLHLTVHFLGDTDVSAVSRLIRELELLPWPDIHTQVLDRWLFFPGIRQARVGSLGTWPEETRTELRTLWRLTAEVLTRLGLPVDSRPFLPHLSVVRFGAPVRLGREDLGQLTVSPLAFEVRALTLYESLLTPEGARYAALAEFPLARKIRT